MVIISIDPGTIYSAYCKIDKEYNLLATDKIFNDEMLSVITEASDVDMLIIEQIRSYGMNIGATTLDTVEWCGRFRQRWLDVHNKGFEYLPRMEVKMNVCHSSRAKDKNIRQALLERFGCPGTKKNPGPTFGLSGDKWAAFGVGITYLDTRVNNKVFV